MAAVIVTAAVGAVYLAIRRVQVERQYRRQMIRRMGHAVFRSTEEWEMLHKIGAV